LIYPADLTEYAEPVFRTVPYIDNIVILIKSKGYTLIEVMLRYLPPAMGSSQNIPGT